MYALRQVLKRAHEAGRLPTDRYFEVYEALRGFVGGPPLGSPMHPPQVTVAPAETSITSPGATNRWMVPETSSLVCTLSPLAEPTAEPRQSGFFPDAEAFTAMLTGIGPDPSPTTRTVTDLDAVAVMVSLRPLPQSSTKPLDLTLRSTLTVASAIATPSFA